MQDTDHPVDPFVKPTHQHYLLTENATHVVGFPRGVEGQGLFERRGAFWGPNHPPIPLM